MLRATLQDAVSRRPENKVPRRDRRKSGEVFRRLQFVRGLRQRRRALRERHAALAFVGLPAAELLAAVRVKKIPRKERAGKKRQSVEPWCSKSSRFLRREIRKNVCSRQAAFPVRQSQTPRRGHRALAAASAKFLRLRAQHRGRR